LPPCCLASCRHLGPGRFPARRGEPAVERKVSEDDGVRIEELRVRGETQRIVVRSKVAGARVYEILPAGGGRDLSQDKRAIGQRVWSVLELLGRAMAVYTDVGFDEADRLSGAWAWAR
jgi:hypothetical protein